MRVLVVTTWLPTAERPEAGIFVARDIQMLRERHDVEVIHLASDGTPAEVPFPVTTVPIPTVDPSAVRRAGKLIAERALHADLVHTMAASALLPFTAMRLHRPWVHTEHWSALLAPATVPIAARASIPLIRRLIRRPDVVISVGNDLASAIGRTRLGTTVVIPNEVHRPAAVAERLSSSTLTLVGVGGLIERKGVDIAIRVVAELIRRGEDARLIWAGEGELRGPLTSLAVELGISDRIQLRGRAAPPEVEELLASADVFLLPTMMETFGVAIAEALVAGRPVVVSSSGEQSSFVAEPDGVLVDGRSAIEYADAVQRVVELNRDRTADEIAQATTAAFDPSRRRDDTDAAYAQAGALFDAHTPCDVDVIIAAHDSRRNVNRAVASVLSSRSVRAVYVVCHNVAEAAIREAVGAAAEDPRVGFIEFHDDVRSPAGPFNRGLDAVEGAFAMVMGSDDEVTPAAIDAWRRTASRDAADMVIAPLRHAGGTRVPTPPTMRTTRLRGRRDRLAYRTAPLGLFSTATFADLRFTPGLATGEDLSFTTSIWFSDARISRHRGSGEYLIHDDAERVTSSLRPLRRELEAVRLLIESADIRELATRDREALAVKLWRVPVFGAVHYRAGRWGDDDREALRELSGELRVFSPTALEVLSRADRALIDALEDMAVSDTEIDNRSRQRRRFLSPAALIPARISRLFGREAPLRFSAATWWALRS